MCNLLFVNQICSFLRALFSALRQSTSLTEANLSNNHFGKKGAKSLHLGIKFGRLTLLDISGNEIGKKGSKSLARAIKVNSTLHRVGLSCSDLISLFLLTATLLGFAGYDLRDQRTASPNAENRDAG